MTLAYIPNATVEPIVTVKDTDDLVRAKTLMSLHNFSQLPVVRGKGNNPVGVVTWESIGRALIDDANASLLECTDNDAPKLPLSTNLLDAIPLVNERGFVLVMKDTRNLSGIITSADLGEALAHVAKPFLLFERLEEALRRITGTLQKSGQLSAADVARAIPHTTRAVDAEPENFTLGELIAITTDKRVWASATEVFDRDLVCQGLQDAAALRNQLMHFRAMDSQHERSLDQLPRLVTLLESIADTVPAEQTTLSS